MKKKYLSIILAVIMLFTASQGLWSSFASAAVADDIISKQADSLAVDEDKPFHVSTRYDGRIWVNKSVGADKLEFEKADGGTVSYASGASDEFTVALSALAQSFTTETEITVKRTANIVLVLDISRSMNTNMTDAQGKVITRLALMKSASSEFIDSIAASGIEATINISLVTYSGVGKIKLGWTNLTDATKQSVKTVITNLAEEGGNTNMQAGAYLANYLYDNFTETSDGTELNRNDEYTNNFVLFMSDGSPNRNYTTDVIPMNSAKTETLDSSLTDIVLDTDYTLSGATKALEQIEQFDYINGEQTQMTVFSLGLGGWFTPDGKNSSFPTSVNFCKLIAALGNRKATLVECIGYLGNDIPNGAMPSLGGINATYPVLTESNFINGSSYRIRTQYNGYKGFSTWDVTLDALENDSRWATGNLENRMTQGVYSIPDVLSAQIVNYYAGNTVETFKASFNTITIRISHAFTPFVTSITDTSNPDIDGKIVFSDRLGDYMEVRDFKGLVYDGVPYDGALFSQTFTEKFFDEQHDLFYTEVYQTVLKSFSKSFNTDFTMASARALFVGAEKGGSIYYNSDDDFGSSVNVFARYNEEKDAFEYLGAKYAQDGTELEMPEGTTHLYEAWFVLSDVSSTAITSTTSSLMYIIMGVATNISTGKQIVRCQIPASLLPARVVTVNDNETPEDEMDDYAVDNGALPVHMVYNVGLKKYFTKVSKDYEYINADETANIYSNDWREGKQTTAKFTSSKNNPFYTLSQNEAVYVKNEDETYSVATELDTSGETAYYVYHDYVEEEGINRYFEDITYYALEKPEVTEVIDGILCVKKGTVRTHLDSTIDDRKPDNNSGTATDAIDVLYGQNSIGEPYIVASLGNNGVLSLPKEYVEQPEITTEETTEPTTEPTTKPVIPTGGIHVVTDKGKGYDIFVDGVRYVSWATFEVPYGGSFTFTVNVYPLFGDGDYTVLSNGRTLEPNSDGITYTIDNITEHQVITVIGVKKDKLTSILKNIMDIFAQISEYFQRLIAIING